MDKQIKVFRMWKIDFDADWNVILEDCENDKKVTLFHELQGEDSPVDVAVQYLNRQGHMISGYAMDTDFSVVLLADK